MGEGRGPIGQHPRKKPNPRKEGKNQVTKLGRKSPQRTKRKVINKKEVPLLS
jgi:hypothetical protein